MEKITPSHSLPQTDVTFEAWKFQHLHERIMNAATRWAGAKSYDYGERNRTEANTYISALMLILTGSVPDEELDSIFDEYQEMMFGREVSHANKNQ